MGIYQIGSKWYIDLYVDGRRRRKSIGSRKEAENAQTAIKADVLRGEFKFKRESKVHFEAFAQDYLKHMFSLAKNWKKETKSNRPRRRPPVSRSPTYGGYLYGYWGD